VVRQEDPGREQETALVAHPRQGMREALEILVLKPPSRFQQGHGYKEVPVVKKGAARRHAANLAELQSGSNT